jgi:hypothetical protein
MEAVGAVYGSGWREKTYIRSKGDVNPRMSMSVIVHNQSVVLTCSRRI